MRKYGVKIPKGIVVSSVAEVKQAIRDAFPSEKEVVVKIQVLAGGRGLGAFKKWILWGCSYFQN
jgi:succinyl-CoA synthetase beta subunit